MAGKSGSKALAAIYAEALYEAAKESGSVDQVTAELKLLRILLVKAPKLEKLLESPTISFEEKRKVIEGTFKHLSKVTRNFLLVLVDRKRAHLIGTIVSAFIETMNKKAGIAAVDVHTARPLDLEEREQLKTLLSKKLNKTVNLNESVKPELLGGLVLIHEDKMWDRSTRHALDQMVEKMEGLKLATIKWTD
ncbi:MAG TPA: ATP synthase F1 subunit delta [Planctomycetota bacterium]|nr:ATP synthase F1 subunit delta [Planctomycetota bacterium]